ncbi:D-tyrosyl-tRNA(Tyr) deacylase [Myxococcota bacterium]|nr:D-tyrosyl-tRNA(Tyr) deacylase [Myxococcota bacterium]MBU1429839.1 D-tyrosyl-tRNA(Tyr) deacylase [Myxococcota bacterium]MBU1897751.1 D-tyrosyl-tRNA(Tyr) deacylase [Myxococcota bacterium]
MRAVVQRVSRAKVTVEGVITGAIERGLLVLVGAEEGDTLADVDYTARKVAGLRIFEDEAGKMNLDVGEVGGAVLAVSQFTLLGDARKGRRPAFVKAARPEVAEPLYQRYLEQTRALGLRCEAGIFQAMMSVELVNEGPVTILIDSRRAF